MHKDPNVNGYKEKLYLYKSRISFSSKNQLRWFEDESLATAS